jgi:hypothetical protein
MFDICYRLVIPKLQTEAHFPLHRDILYFEDFHGKTAGNLGTPTGTIARAMFSPKVRLSSSLSAVLMDVRKSKCPVIRAARVFEMAIRLRHVVRNGGITLVTTLHGPFLQQKQHERPTWQYSAASSYAN